MIRARIGFRNGTYIRSKPHVNGGTVGQVDQCNMPLTGAKNENGVVNIRQRGNQGNQSKHLVEISERIAAGTPISHILNYRLSQEPTNKAHASDIRKILKTAVWEQQNFEQVETIPGVCVSIPVLWRMPTAGSTCAYYYTDAGFTYSDSAIKKHTRMMLQRLTSQIRGFHPEYGTDWGLAYLVTRALDAAVLQEGHANQSDGAVGGAGDGDGDDDDDEEE